MFHVVAAAALAVLVQADPGAGDAAFLRAAAEARAAVRPYVPVQTAGRGISSEDLDRQLLELLGPFDALLGRAEALEPAAMSREIQRRLRSGASDGLILGESHGEQAEEGSGRLFVGDLLDSGFSLQALLREDYTYEDVSRLEKAKVPVYTFRNQFRPEPDVLAALKLPRPGPLVTYTGHAHTVVRLKDYFLYVLKEGKPWGYERGKKDMPTVEEAFRKGGRRPLTVAMVTESRVFRRIQMMFLRSLVGTGAELAGLRSDLEAFRRVWERRMASYPASSAPIRFVRSPDQEDLYVGLTPAPRRATDIEPALQVLALPELAQWLGRDKVKLLESLYGTGPDSSGRIRPYYMIVVHRLSGGESFTRYVWPEGGSSFGRGEMTALGPGRPVARPRCIEHGVELFDEAVAIPE